MLSDEERDTLSAIEARLVDDDPALHDALAHLMVPDHDLVRVRRRHRPGVRTLVAFALAIALTAVVTWLAGPDTGAATGVSSLCVAAMYGLNQFGCPYRNS